MWKEGARFIIKYRLYVLLSLAAITVFMGYHARKVEMSYEFMRIIPEDDPDIIYYERFRELFGQDATAFVVGTKSPELYELSNFNKFRELNQKIAKAQGVTGVYSIADPYSLVTNKEEQRFELKRLMESAPSSQAELDSIIAEVHQLKFYDGTLFGKDGATIMAISLNADTVNSKNRIPVMNNLINQLDEFSEDTGIQLHYSGLPYIRTLTAELVKSELVMFIILAAAITGVVLFLFFRSFSAVFVPLTMIGMIVVWIMGTLGLLGFKITALTGLLPPVLIVIGIPNSIYILNKYHQEYSRHGNKIWALNKVIKKIGVVTLITNTTTAIGFCVLISTGITAMQEFGIVAGINIFATFVVSLTFIPAVFSYLPAPDTRHLNHLSVGPTQGFIHMLEIGVTNYRKHIYAGSIVIVILSLIGANRVQAVSYLVDDLPNDSRIMQDLKFFEDHFGGVMPLEVVIDTGFKKGYRRKGTLNKIDELQTAISTLPEVTPGMSLVTMLKVANQALYKGDTTAYRMPTRTELGIINKYLKNQGSSEKSLSEAFIDPTGRYLRVSMNMADIGSIRMDSLLQQEIRPTIQRIFGDNAKLDAFVTGTTLIFVKGNDFLIQNLKQSMLIAFVLIALIMGTLFGNLRIVIISLIPNIIPLLVTAGLMGYLGIPLKPSTAIIFSIAFGISVDDSIHFLAKYRQEMKLHGLNLKRALTVSIRETGTSMLYTSIVLFCGFTAFTFSAFGGTKWLGLLTSTTLLVAMITNLVLLPALLYTFDVNRQDLEPIIEGADEFYFEDEDEEIDLNLVKRS